MDDDLRYIAVAKDGDWWVSAVDEVRARVWAEDVDDIIVFFVNIDQSV